MTAAASLICFITYTFSTTTTLASMIVIYTDSLTLLIPHNKNEADLTTMERTTGWLAIAQNWSYFTLVGD
jgi:hypothetical protein